MLHHFFEDAAELGSAQGLPGDIGEDLDATGAKLRDRSVDLRERSIDVVHGQRRDERGKAVRVAAADIGERIVGEARELRRLRWRRDQFEWWVGERDDLSQVVELVKQTKPRIDVDQRLEPRKGGHRDMVGRDFGQAVQIRLRHEVIEHIDHHVVSPRGLPRTAKAGAVLPLFSVIVRRDSLYIMLSFGSCHPCRSTAMRRLVTAMTTLVLAALATLGPAGAQSYPAKPIRVIVPFVAGGAVDVLARLVSAKMSESIGQPVIVENRAGAAGNVAADAVAKAPPDGYTILQNTNGQAISPALYRSLPFDVDRKSTRLNS